MMVIETARGASELTGLGVVIISAAVSGIVSVVTTTIAWKVREGHENRKMWAQSAIELTKMYIQGWQYVSEVSKEPVQILAPVKAYREILKTLEAYGKTGKWSDTLEKQGILNVTTITPSGREAGSS